MSIKVATILAQSIIAELEKGTIPWDKAYNDPTLPYNPATDKAYNGFNAFILMFASASCGGNQFIGLKQAQKLGGKLKNSEDYRKGIPIYCPIMKKIEDKKTGENKNIPVSFCFRTVYPLSYFEGIDSSKITLRETKRQNDPIKAADDFVALRNPKIESGSCPCYIPALDKIKMPDRNSYLSSDHYYSTLMHEIGHWTGAKERKNREGILDSIRFGSEKYGKEELVAEMFSFFVRGHLGLETDPDNAERKNRLAYLQGWIEKIKAEPQILIGAASAAEAAMKWYIGEGQAVEAEGDEAEVA
jgi:antirestriction protein ArdC